MIKFGPIISLYTRELTKVWNWIMETYEKLFVFMGDTLGVMGLYMFYSDTGPIMESTGEQCVVLLE